MIKRLPRWIIVLALLLPGFSGAQETGWITDKNGCKIVNIAPQDGESADWSGDCRKGFAHGDGTLTWSMSGVVTEIYQGSMAEGYAEGQGKLWRRGGAYVGEWKRSLQHGRGRYEDEDGSWYHGEWAEGVPHGRGKMRTPDGKVLDGEWNKGEWVEPDAMPNRT
ncbi:MAG: hypothetical protein ACO25D_07195 [Burkholderiaceae bacterium]